MPLLLISSLFVTLYHSYPALWQAALDEEGRRDAECRGKYGPDKWRAAPSASVAKPYWDRVSSYRSSLQKAAASDQGVVKQLNDNEKGLGGLNAEAAAAQMPRLQVR